jgi:hypothetical protein
VINNIVWSKIIMSSDNLSRSFDTVPKLSGKENFVTWNQRIKLALAITRSSQLITSDPSLPSPPYSIDNTSPLEMKANNDWIDRDRQIAAGILLTCDEDILKAHIHLLDEPFPRSIKVYQALEKVYGTTGAQYTFALGRQFLDMKCEDGGDVEAWVNQAIARYRELKLLEFNLDQLCVNVLLNGLPARFGSYLDQVWTSSENPSIESVKLAILRINAGNHARSDDSSALAARISSLSLPPPSTSLQSLSLPPPSTDLQAFYAQLRRSGKKPSKEHPCARCGSHVHWVVDCPDPGKPREQARSKKRWLKRDQDRGEGAKIAQEGSGEIAGFTGQSLAMVTSVETVLLVDSNIDHALMSIALSTWILDSGASQSRLNRPSQSRLLARTPWYPTYMDRLAFSIIKVNARSLSRCSMYLDWLSISYRSVNSLKEVRVSRSPRTDVSSLKETTTSCSHGSSAKLG